jgi:transposase
VARKNYSDEFRRQAADLYESTPGATVPGIAEDLGIVRGTMRHWLQAYGTGKKTAAHETVTSSPLLSKSPAPSAAASREETPEQRIARLEAERGTKGRDDEADHRAGDPPAGGQVFRRGDALVSRFQFVADNSATFEGVATVCTRRDRALLVLRLEGRSVSACRPRCRGCRVG